MALLLALTRSPPSIFCSPCPVLDLFDQPSPFTLPLSSKMLSIRLTFWFLLSVQAWKQENTIQILETWTYAKPNRTQSCATCSSWPCLSSGVGLEISGGPYPPQPLYDPVIRCCTFRWDELPGLKSHCSSPELRVSQSRSSQRLYIVDV